jgi:hypothetical protein
MGLFNVGTSQNLNGIPVRFNFEVDGAETLEQVYAILVEKGFLLGTRVSFASDSTGRRVVREKTPEILGGAGVVQIAHAKAPPASGAATVHERPPYASARSEKTRARVVR